MVSRRGRDCRGEACLARRVRSTRIAIILYIYSAGEARLAPTKPCGSKANDKGG